MMSKGARLSVGTASPMLFKFAKKISGDDQGASDEGFRHGVNGGAHVDEEEG
jgi:hypothetical protein